MRKICFLLLLLIGCHPKVALAQASKDEAEYYLAAYAQHYGVPLDFGRAIVEQESNWHPCAISSKGAVGLMQLMRGTAARLGVRNRCSIRENISGGIRHLAWLIGRFHDLRLVAAAYYAGASAVAQRGLRYANSDVVNYVASIRNRVAQQKQIWSVNIRNAPRRTR